MKKINGWAIAALVLFVCFCIQVVNLNRLETKYTEAYQTACALSDIIRMHLDDNYDKEGDMWVVSYTDQLKDLCYDIDSIDWKEYSWCY